MTSPASWLASSSDAHGRLHTIIDKGPTFTGDPLDLSSAYPKPGAVRCEVLDLFQDETERNLARITLERPDCVESTTCISEFMVLESQIET
jgi:hypothetical protein